MKPITSYAEANEYLRQFYNLEHIKYDLVNMKRLMSYLGNPQNKLRVIHVAGTSGKTSTAYYVAALLTAAGKKTGLTVGPIVDEINERVQINGLPLDEGVFCLALTDFSKAIEKAPVKPSWFELMIAFAYWYFAANQVDYAVIEVGLGGLKDATNVVLRSDKVCVITDIGYDHINVLGKSLRNITIQKTGIILPDNPVFTYKQEPEIMSTIENTAASRNASLFTVEGSANPDKMMPDYQFRNWSLANAVYKYLVNRDGINNLNDQDLLETRRVIVPGRMDVSYLRNKTVIMDGAHNAQKIKAFVGSFRKLYPGIKPAVLIAMRGSKAHEDVAKELATLASKVITTTFSANHDLPVSSISADKLAEVFKDKVPTKSISDQVVAFEELMRSPETFVVITGSIYFLGQIRNNPLLTP